MKNSFVMYTDYMQHLEMMDMEQRGLFLTAVMKYASGTDLPEMDGMVRMAFSFAKAQMDRDSDQYQKKVEARREAGRIGGLAKSSKTSNAKQSLANLPDTDTVTVTDTDIKKKVTKVTKEKAERFSPPTLDEVKEYCREKGYTSIDAERFIDFYASKGWIVGKTKMKDWKAAVRNWERTQRQELTAKAGDQRLESTAKAAKKNRFNNFDQRQHDYDSMVFGEIRRKRDDI